MKRYHRALTASVFLPFLLACGSEESGGPGIIPGTGGQPNVAGSSPNPGDAGRMGLAGSSGIGLGGNFNVGGGQGEGGSGGSCASSNAQAKVLPVYLAFAFDVSGSMGAGDTEWHDKSLKWDPVVAATRAFLEDPASQGLNASMTFFPAADDECEGNTYRRPDVAMTALPSMDFGVALEPRGRQWRSGTPTLHALRGVSDYVDTSREQTPGRYVIVLVTDGYPQGCDADDNMIEPVVTEAAAIAATTPVYVIGVKNPPVPDAPDTVTNLNGIAVAGGTQQAYIIDTGNPAQTTATFKATIDSIRGAAVSCDVQIPAAPDGRMFDKEKVAVTAGQTPLTYDATCAGPNTWQYDDPANPRVIRLCPAACDQLQNNANASLNVEFTCEPRIIIPR